MKTIKFPIPEGYIQDTDNSSPKELVFKYQKSGNIMERIIWFEDALQELGMDDEDVKEFYNLTYKISYTSAHIRLINFTKLIIITKALNEGWKPNLNNNELKYYNYFYMNNGTLSCSDHAAYLTTFMYMPSNLFFKSRELAEYAAKIALAEYKLYMEK